MELAGMDGWDQAGTTTYLEAGFRADEGCDVLLSRKRGVGGRVRAAKVGRGGEWGGGVRRLQGKREGGGFACKWFPTALHSTAGG